MGPRVPRAMPHKPFSIHTMTITTDALKPKLILPLALNIPRNSVTSIIASSLARDHSTQMDGSEAIRYLQTPPAEHFQTD